MRMWLSSAEEQRGLELHGSALGGGGRPPACPSPSCNEQRKTLPEGRGTRWVLGCLPALVLPGTHQHTGDVCRHLGPYRKPYQGVKLSLGSLAWNVGMLEKTAPVSVVLAARLGEARAPLPSSATHILLFSGEQGQLLSTPHPLGNLSCYRPFV